MSATQTMLSQQFIDTMGSMIGDAKAVDSVFAYIRLLRSTRQDDADFHPITIEEVNARLDQAEQSFAVGQGLEESIARQHRHSWVKQLVVHEG